MKLFNRNNANKDTNKKGFFRRNRNQRPDQNFQQNPNIPDNPGIRNINEELNAANYSSQLNKNRPPKGPQENSNFNQVQHNLKETKKVKRVSMLNYYTERLLNKMTHGSLDIQGSAFEISYSKIMSETNKKRVIMIDEYPTYLSPGHLERIRLEAKRIMPEEDRDKVEINIIEHSMGHHIAFKNNRKLKSSERNFRRQLNDTTSEKIKRISQLHTGATMMGTSRDDISQIAIREERLKRKVYSFGHVNRHQAQGYETIKSYIFIEIIGETNQLTDDLADIVLNLLNSNNYKFEEVTDLQDYLENFGMASLKFQKKMKWDIHPMTLTTDVSSATPTYSEGIIRSEAGDVYMGNSLDTGYPVFISFSESSASSNVLILADSGSGKTVFMKMLTLGSLNHRGNTYNVVVTDYKGEEWDSLVEMIDKSEVISMGISNPKFINTLIIPDYKEYGFAEPRSAFDLAVGYTTKMLTTLVNVQDKLKTTQVQNICNDIVDYVYRVNGINVLKPSTFVKSKDLNFADELWTATEFICTKSEDMEVRHGKELLGIVKTALEYYFTTDGSKRYMFKNSLDMDSLMNLKFIVFDYGAQTAGGNSSMQENEIHMKILQKNFFTTLYSAKNKLKGQYTIEIEEEVQRQINSPLLLQQLGVEVVIELLS